MCVTAIKMRQKFQATNLTSNQNKHNGIYMEASYMEKGRESHIPTTSKHLNENQN